MGSDVGGGGGGGDIYIYIIFLRCVCVRAAGRRALAQAGKRRALHTHRHLHPEHRIRRGGRGSHKSKKVGRPKSTALTPSVLRSNLSL